MPQGVRRLLLVSGLLLGALLLLLATIKPADLYDAFQQRLQRESGIHIIAGQPSISILHGIGLRIDHLDVDHHDFHLQAGHLVVTVQLLPLLLGEVKAEELDLHDAIITLQANHAPLNPAAIAELPLQRIQLVRSQIVAADGSELLSNVQFELRDIGAESESLWDFSASQGAQSISGQGRLNFHQRNIIAGFGNLKIKAVPLARLQGFAPSGLAPLLRASGGLLNGALTLDIIGATRWSVFGELDLSHGSDEEAVRLRGKIRHPSSDRLEWDDSFIHLANRGVIAIHGRCLGGDCATELDGKQIPFQTWQPFFPVGVTFQQQLSGVTNLHSRLHWSSHSWGGEIALQLRDGRYRYRDAQQQAAIALPELRYHSQQLHGDGASWQIKGELSAPAMNEQMQISSAQQADGEKVMRIEGKAVDAPFWQPLANLLLASLDLHPLIHADGRISGALTLRQQQQKKTLHLQLDTSASELQYGASFSKPKQLQARCDMTFGWLQQQEKQLQSLDVAQCQLGGGHLASLTWQRQRHDVHFGIRDLTVDFDQLHAHHVRLPEQWQALHGKLAWSGTMRWPLSHPERWLDHADGLLQVDGFGSRSWLVDARLRADHGLLRGDGVRLKGEDGQALLDVTLLPAKRRAKINVQSAHLNWPSSLALPEFWQSWYLHGALHHSDLHLLSHDWQQFDGYFSWRHERLTLREIHGSLAGGEVHSKQLLLQSHQRQSNQRGVEVSGKVRMKHVKLAQLSHLSDYIHGTLQGALHANLDLHGLLPAHDIGDWRQSNGDIVIYDGSWQPEGTNPPAAFDKFEARFRVHRHTITIHPLRLQQSKIQYQGGLRLDRDNRFHGEVVQQGSGKRYIISGSWPQYTLE